MSGRMRLIPILLFGLYFVYYYFGHQERVPMTGRKQLVDMSREQEARLGFQSFQEILRTERIVRTGPLADKIREVGQKIAKVSEDPGFQWEYALIDSPEVNAFCLPGGKVAVYTGILPIAANDSGLAAIMGHEIAHAIARHGAERMAQQKLLQIGTLAAGVAVSDMDRRQQQAIMGALGIGGQFGIMLPFSRSHESEADYMGLMYAAKACYDPREAPKLWERMARNSKGQPAEFMSTHPAHQTRIRDLTKWMPEALEARTAAGCPPLPQ